MTKRFSSEQGRRRVGRGCFGRPRGPGTKRSIGTTASHRSATSSAIPRRHSHIAFHRSFWEASENALLPRLWPVTEAHLTIALAEDKATRADPVRAHEVHAQLVATLRTGDMAAIEAAFTTHTMDSAEELIALLSGDDKTV
ncbi:FCD domain-containing protein [Arthrobacter sp. H-02-3]|uniref:FCD domain-containing protein n=1 Tax=Arthrobacter sp. H-02-3 TaxID=2703675 RepID=UPI00192A3D91|nr:FCD domain-containing protein [Arthrobacter sp. H-02-3]